MVGFVLGVLHHLVVAVAVTCIKDTRDADGDPKEEEQHSNIADQDPGSAEDSAQHQQGDADHRLDHFFAIGCISHLHSIHRIRVA